MAKRKTNVSNVAITSGIILILIAWFIFTSDLQGFFTEIRSEVFSVGLALTVFGLIFKLFKVRVG